MIGHTGIGDSKGITHDFAGPYTISVDNFSFGEPYYYVPLDLDGVSVEQYDKAIEEADNIYSKKIHKLIFDNCHSHVAQVLNILKYKGKTNWTMIDVWYMCMTQGKYVSIKH